MKKYIDRDALVEYAYRQYGMLTANDIMEFPTADVQPVKHGRWMNRNGHPVSTTLSCYSAKCSECELYSGMQYTNKPYNYCPYCGSKMDLKEI